MASPSAVSVLHVSAWREDRGGIQSTLRHHHEGDARLGLAPGFISVFDRTATWPGACVSLGCHGWMSLRGIRERFRAAAAKWPGALVIYHDGWGLEWFARDDGAARRLVYLHTERAQSDALVRTFARRVDGFVAVSRAFADRVRRVLPDFPAERIGVPPFFVEPPEWVRRRPEPDGTGRPWRLGYAGRVEQGHKRLDRLPALLAALDRHKFDYRFEVLGEGSYLPELQRQLRRDDRVTFSGWRTGEHYWRTLANWDVLVLLSDTEGFSRVTMEGMCCGVHPVHPDFSPAATELLGPTAERGLYPTGDVAAAADRIVTLATLPAETRHALRQAGATHLAGHTAQKYDEAWGGFLERIKAMPARAVAPAPPFGLQDLPLGVCTRIFPHRF